jgi:uncharacterized protein
VEIMLMRACFWRPALLGLTIGMSACGGSGGGDTAGRPVGGGASSAPIAAEPPRSDRERPFEGPTHYLEVSDGTQIAMHVRMPDNYVEGRRYATIVEIAGYDNGSSDGPTLTGRIGEAAGLPFALPLAESSRTQRSVFFEDRYVTVQISLRGTGCSSGEFDLFSLRSALDGHEAIEWLARQPWSNGDVGLYGHSYSGITGTLVASTRPPSLRVITLSGLIGDLYRDLVYPGGLTNYGFPLLWTGAVRPLFDYGGGKATGIAGEANAQKDPRCLQNQAASSRTVIDEPLVHGAIDQDTPWFQVRSTVNYAPRINVPTQIVTAYQDEQVGPRGGAYVFDLLDPAVPRRLVMLNGNHEMQSSHAEVVSERNAWVDHYLLGRPNPFVDPRSTPESARVLLEVHCPTGGSGGYQSPGSLGVIPGASESPVRLPTVSTSQCKKFDFRSNGYLESQGFPLAETRFTDFHLRADGSLSREAAGPDESGTAYVHGSKRQFYADRVDRDYGGELTASAGPDELRFATAPFDQPLVIAGPPTITLWLSSLATDTELFVQLLDEAPTGELTYLQRGMLRASHRAIDPARSQSAAGHLYRPWRPHRNPEAIVPGAAVEYLIEIFPVGHVFRPGHRLVVKISAPPLDDNDWIYIPKTLPTINAVWHSAERPSRLTLPVIPLAAVRDLGPELAPCSLAKMRCVKPLQNEPAGGGPGGLPGFPVAQMEQPAALFGQLPAELLNAAGVVSVPTPVIEGLYGALPADTPAP